MPGFYKVKDIGTVYSSMPYFGPNSGVITSEKYDTLQVHKLLIDFLLNELKKLPNLLSLSVYTPFFSKTDYYSTIFQDAIRIDQIFQYTPINNLNWNRSLQYDIRRAQQLGVTVVEDINMDDLNEFWRIHFQNCETVKIPAKPEKSIEFLYEKGRENGSVKLYLAKCDGKVIGGLMVLWSPSTVSYCIPATDPEFRSLQPGSLLIDHAFQQAKESGLKVWNWERSPSKESGVYKFKSRWNAEDGISTVYILPFQSQDVFQKIEKEGLLSHFPYYYVYPFNLLKE